MFNIRRITLCAVLGACTVAGTASAGPATRPAAGGNATEQERAYSEVRRVMNGKAVCLSTADATAPDRYHFLVRVALPRKEGGTLASDYLIERDGDEVAVLVRSADGLPFAYATNGLFVGIDPKEPGRLVTFTGGSPTFAYEARADGSGLVFDLSYVKDAAKPSLVFDARSLLAAALGRSVAAKFDPDRHAVEVRTANATLVLLPSAPEKAGDFAVEGLTTTTTASGATISVTDIHVERKLCVNVLGVTADSVRKLGLPIRELADADRRTLLLVPPDYGKDERERHAAEKFATLFRSGPASRPADASGR